MSDSEESLATFVVSSCLFVLIVFSFMNESLIMNLEITPGQTVLWWTGILGTVLATCRTFIRQPRIPEPHKHMREMSKHIHRDRINLTINHNGI